MQGIINYGDAIVYRQFKKDLDYSKLKTNDIIVFKVGNDLIVHRIISIVIDDKDIYVKTKGDRNEKADPYVLHKSDILGKYNFKIKYLGIPTILFNNL